MAQPVHKVKAGQVSAALWENEIPVNGKQIKVLRATVERRLKDKSGTWKSSGSFSRTELPLVVWALQKCFDYMMEGQNSDDNGVTEKAVM